MAKPAAKRSSDDAASALEPAYEAYYGAEYRRCIDALSSLPAPVSDGVEATLLRARAFYRMEDAPAAFDAATRAREAASTPSDVVVAHALCGAVLRALKKPREAAAVFERAADALNRASTAARAEFGYYVAFAAWEDGDLVRAESLIEQQLSAATDVLLGMLVQLLGWVEVRRERYAAAAERFLEALDVISSAQRKDVRFTARLVHGLAIIASETIDLRLAQRYERHLTEIRWTSGVHRQHFNTLTCQRFVALLQGDLERAWRLALDAIYAAPSDALRAIAETNAAVVSTLVGDSFAARAHFAAGWGFIESISWSKADEEERVALTNFAIEAASVMPSEARSAVTRYRNITGALDARLALHGDRRMQAFEAMAAGRVSEVMGKVKDAVENYERSRQLWVALDYRMRAALVAHDQHRLTGDRRYLHDVDVALARAPQAWFGAPGFTQPRSPVLAQLTPAERTVLRHLLGGESTGAIATQLGRSPYTVHNHTRQIFAAFKVRTRAALLARCAEQGIAPDKIA
jgi:DNA-binding CsgD family transcriptional regulator/tetratricopeptide (TPR) repeat protein